MAFHAENALSAVPHFLSFFLLNMLQLLPLSIGVRVCVFVLLLCLQSNDPSASQPSPFPNSRRFWLHARFLNAFFSLSFCFRVFKVGVLARSLREVVPSMSCPFFLSWFVCSLSMRGAHLLSEL